MDVTEIVDENYRLKKELEAYSQISLDDITKLANTANIMADLLMRCRNEPIDYKLAQEIDYVMEQIEDLG